MSIIKWTCPDCEESFDEEDLERHPERGTYLCPTCKSGVFKDVGA